MFFFLAASLLNVKKLPGFLINLVERLEAHGNDFREADGDLLATARFPNATASTQL